MILRSNHVVHWRQWHQFSSHSRLAHGVFSRQGGFSEAPFDALNVALNHGDCRQKVAQNRRLIEQALGVPTLVPMSQVHGNRVVIVENSQGPGEPCDGMITRQPGIALMAQHADCQIALFYDPRNHALALVHAGWRGQVADIYRTCITLMQEHIGSCPQELLVGISPSLGPLSAEFRNYRTEFPETFWPFQTNPGYFNLWEVARQQLQACGILPEHIEVAQLCTAQLAKEYFSYRRDRLTGRNATVACLL